MRALTITIVGPGALGCLFAALFSKAGHSVWILDYNSVRAQRINARGIRLAEGASSGCYAVKSTIEAGEIGRTDVVLLCVKSYDVHNALRLASPLLKEGTLLIAMQNGLGHHEVLRQSKGLCWAVGITAQGAALLEPGVVRHGGSGITTLGFIDEVDETAQKRLAEIAALFEAAGVPTVLSSDIEAAVWDKLLVNVGINALTALYGCSNGELLENRQAMLQLRQAVNEAAAVALAKGIKITKDPVSRTKAVCRATSKNISSMLQDIRHHRKTEIESINGAIIREAASLGIDVPVNKKLTLKIQKIKETV